MTIIELCGLPGAGKSTLTDCMREKYPEPGFLTRGDILSNNKMLRHLNTAYRTFLYKAGIKNKKELPLYSFMSEYPGCSSYFAVRLVDLFRKLEKIKNKNGLLIFEEGPLQYISSIPFDKPIKDSDSLKESLMLLSDQDIHIVDCKCSIDTGIERIRNRTKASDRYSSRPNEELRELLRIKRGNLDVIIRRSGLKTYDMDMNAAPEENAGILHRIVMDALEKKEQTSR